MTGAGDMALAGEAVADDLRDGGWDVDKVDVYTDRAVLVIRTGRLVTSRFRLELSAIPEDKP